MSLDDFTTAAQALCAAAGQPDLDLLSSMTRRTSGDEYYLGTAVGAGFNWDAKQGYATSKPTAELALADFAQQLGVSYPLTPVEYATAEQKENLIKLYNTPFCKAWEKSKMLLNINRYTYAEAEKMLADGPLSFRQELVRRQAASRGMGVVAEAYQVQPIAA